MQDTKIKEIIISTMKEEDIQSVLEIERMSFSTPWSETSFYNEIYNPHSTAKIAVIKERVAGYICAKQVSDEGHILNLAVHPEFRRKWIASALVEDVLKNLKDNGCRFLYLEVRSSNYAAKRLYDGFGFKIIGTRKGYYNEPREDAIIMMLKIYAT
ncbi:MAG: ribosomal protein S18-alanine N-acetyltransferase [Nitrospirae bacterium]|nr:ribosomal protein S18-alanine N-acetyltransferase [Nitrospirota bacterium]